MFKQQKREKKSVLIAINLPQLIAYYVLTKRCSSSRKWNLDGLGPLLIAHKEPFPSPFVLSSTHLVVKFKF